MALLNKVTTKSQYNPFLKHPVSTQGRHLVVRNIDFIIVLSSSIGFTYWNLQTRIEVICNAHIIMCKEDSLRVPFVTCNSEVVLKGS